MEDHERFFRPPYTGPSGWVGVVLDINPDWDIVARLVRDAFVHVATRKLIEPLKSLSRPRFAARWSRRTPQRFRDARP